jgi:aprataxin
MGLGAYLEDPASYPSSRVIYHNDSFVAINDRYPKATIHTLLLPRSTKHNLLHPFEAFDDPEFLASVKAETARLRALVVKELQRRLGPESRSDAQRQAVLNGDAEPGESGELPAGRDWDAEVISGVHAVPSMRHLHVHVLSREMYSEALRHRKHYNSFNTPFLVNVDDFPLAADDPRRNTKEEAYLKWDMKCWRCGRNFGNQFQKLKEHLKDEYETWKKI